MSFIVYFNRTKLTTLDISIFVIIVSEKVYSWSPKKFCATPFIINADFPLSSTIFVLVHNLPISISTEMF